VDKAPIEDIVNGDSDVEGDASGGSEGADLDLADQTLVEGLSRDVDTSVIQEVSVSAIPHFWIHPYPFLSGLRIDASFPFFVFPFPLFCFRDLWAIGCIRVLIQIFRLFLCDRAFPSRSSMQMPRRRSWSRRMRTIRFLSPSLVSCSPTSYWDRLIGFIL
jgi:hypothetical protein